MYKKFHNNRTMTPSSTSVGQLGKIPTGVASLSISQLFKVKQGSRAEISVSGSQFRFFLS